MHLSKVSSEHERAQHNGNEGYDDSMGASCRHFFYQYSSNQIVPQAIPTWHGEQFVGGHKLACGGHVALSTQRRAGFILPS